MLRQLHGDDLDEHILTRINQSIATDCRTLLPRRPSSTAYKAATTLNCNTSS